MTKRTIPKKIEDQVRQRAALDRDVKDFVQEIEHVIHAYVGLPSTWKHGTSDDIDSKRQELQELAYRLEGQRARLMAAIHELGKASR